LRSLSVISGITATVGQNERFPIIIDVYRRPSVMVVALVVVVDFFYGSGKRRERERERICRPRPP
jgi:hypothetical protein